MRFFAINILLAFVWAALIGEFSLATLGSGFIFAYIILYTVFYGKTSADPHADAYIRRFPKVIYFLCYYIFEIFRSNLIVAYDIMTPNFMMKPGVIALPLEAKTDLEITVLANLISMTPGTLSLDVSEDRKTLYVHAMYIDDPEKLKAEIKNNLEKRVLDILR